MGMTHSNAARIHALGPDGKLYMEKMPITGIIKTHSLDRLITDSGAAGTAMATGRKTKNKMISQLPDGTQPPTILELAKNAGMSTGLIATSTITHATPACFAAHEKSRHDEDNIAADMADNRVDVILGGGKMYWLPSDAEGSVRKDDRNLIKELMDDGYSVVSNKEEMVEVDQGKMLGLFELGSLEYKEHQPCLESMTKKAIELLSENEKGFFLMVEGSQIDWEAHDNEEDGIILETLRFDLAVKAALDFASENGETLVIVTADHETGGATIRKGSRNGENLNMSFSTNSHTATSVPLYAYGPGCLLFTGVYDNTRIPRRMAKLLGLEGLAPDTDDIGTHETLYHYENVDEKTDRKDSHYMKQTIIREEN